MSSEQLLAPRLPFSTTIDCAKDGAVATNVIQSDKTPDFKPPNLQNAVLHAGIKSLDSDSSSDESVTGTGLMSATGSSSNSSIFDFHFRYGRTYHKYCAGEYYMPNDEQEQERMDLQYCIINFVLDGRKILAPIQQMNLVLDQGTGTGIWAMDIGDDFPDTEVLGIDLSPIQPTFVHPNVRFEIDNFNQSWDRPPETFDLVHSSLNNGFGLRNWDSFLAESYRCLKPGGWMEAKEITFLPLSDDDSLPKNCAISIWHEKLHEGATMGAANLRLTSSDVIPLFEKAGFVNIVALNFKIPIGSWPKNAKWKEIGECQHCALRDGLQAFSQVVFRQFLNYSEQDLEIFLMNVRKELGNRAYHWYWPFFTVYGQKPTKCPSSS
ncbi:S-adenosyl-L-methionine-dependent methyltransferase [Halenospora varia]|nr:S-adenosyl-L-methionine-dependent methyltransferase [Halenospora varia]